jgi:hypothetical protein
MTRSRRGHAATAAALTAVLAIPAALTAPAAFAEGARTIASDTPAQILATAVHATVAAHTVTVSCGGAIAVVGLTDNSTTRVGPTSGSQQVAIKEASLDGVATTRLVNKVAYFKGNAAFLQIEFGANGSTWANRWISIAPGQKDYSTVSGGLDMASMRGQLSPTGTLAKAGPLSYKGGTAMEVRGASSKDQAPGKGTARLYVSVVAPNRPLGLSIVSKPSPTATFRGTCTFGHWGAALTVTKPPKSTPITKTNL